MANSRLSALGRCWENHKTQDSHGDILFSRKLSNSISSLENESSCVDNMMNMKLDMVENLCRNSRKDELKKYQKEF